MQSAGVLAPVATLVLVAVTLLGAVPVYRMVARYSPHGLGSIAMIEELVRGWPGKVLVLIQALRFIFFGRGQVATVTHEILRRAVAEERDRPEIHVA